MTKDNKQTLLIIVLVCLALFVLMGNMRKQKVHEGYQEANDGQVEKLESELLADIKKDYSGKSADELVKIAAAQKLLMERYNIYPEGLGPDLSQYVLKSELRPDEGKCIVAKAEDRDKYISKSDIPDPGPKIDLSQYVKKSSIPPEKICPPQKEIDYSQYVLKSSLPPPQKCPACVCPKVHVQAGLCRKCPPAPKCPPPQPCAEVKCPETKPCPPRDKCPEPEPCPVPEEKIRYDIKHIKVPVVVTKVITVDEKGKKISEEIKNNSDPNELIKTMSAQSSNNSNNSNNRNNNNSNNRNNKSLTYADIQKLRVKHNDSNDNGSESLNSGLHQEGNTKHSKLSGYDRSSYGKTLNDNATNYNLMRKNNDYKPFRYDDAELNSEFKSYGIYGMP